MFGKTTTACTFVQRRTLNYIMRAEIFLALDRETIDDALPTLSHLKVQEFEILDFVWAQ